ncbi:hypothetical protein SDRG_12113 [Saprolegnia diclina VS20]|uniref:Translin-associated factor X-interacting protein 1 N-terminal domain-containing protein n=1 Tax=Saprolegnia diclina (strain VS20) TaxID=1156394 RepID=T0RDD3_SAPDV|nr:hypothetical protein SDRG_12113 [Saprolegnia diclina VS20]EQC30263.1 hypothetical protein SDRG_12113 [Saprolegnia diclina VS20]|eukprot:XP_008616395.1 hypothetical protein SDRG_12113 [Saprolegnia diclina VS20]
MDIADILSKYKRSSAASNDAPSSSLPPIESGFLHPVMPTPPKGHKPRTPSKRASLIQQPLYFLKPQEKARPDHRNSYRDMGLLSAADFARGDCAAPNIECWPLGTRVHKEEDALGNNRKGMRPERTPAKPLLLQQLEAFLAAELSIVGATEHMDREADDEGRAQMHLARLQVFRECFLLLIEDFKTYQPLLLRIKAEYEALLDIYTLKVSKIPQYEATIRTMEQEAQHVISERNLINKMKVKALKKQLKSTQAMLTSYAAANASLEDGRTKLQSDLQEQTKRVADVMATNQMLLHSMKRQDERQKQHDSQLSELHGVLQGVTTKYTRAQEEINELRSSILMLEERAGGIDASADKATINHLTRELQELLHAKTTLEKQVANPVPLAESDVLSRILAGMTAQSVSATDMFVSGAPTTVDGFVNGLCTYLLRTPPVPPATTTTVASSVFVTQTHHDEPDEQAPTVTDSGEFFIGQGLDASVPEYLQFDGRVRNLFYSRRDVERWITDIWQQKDISEKLNLHNNALGPGRKRGMPIPGGHHASFLMTQAPATLVPLRQFFASYLAKKFPHRADAVECAYNICEALKQYSYGCECRVFDMTLHGAVPETARLDQLQVVYMVHEAYTTLEKNESENIVANKRKGLVSVGGAMRELRILFPWKTEAAIAALCKALLFEAKGVLYIPYTALLEPDRHGNLSSFCECLRHQHLDEILHLKKLLLTAVHVAEKQAGPDSKGMLSLDTLRHAIKSCDPERTMAATNAILAECTNIPLERLENEGATLVSGASVRSKLEGILVKPSGRLPPTDTM